MLEKVLQKAILNYCKANHYYAVNIYGSGMSAKGIPDIIICKNGKFIALECKVGKNTLQDDQKIHAKRILNNGGVWASPRTLDEAITVIEGT